jgi:hypothetical protein
MLNQKTITINEITSSTHTPGRGGVGGWVKRYEISKEKKKARFVYDHISHHSSLHIDYSWNLNVLII